eukprot:m.666607 g.666607  ORF g.666607 m.666607 type:complete len:326 (+) comp58502_c0_seq4:629-1606(+)
MNFHMVPFEHRDVKAKLSSRFGIRGVPSLVILEPTGEIITKAGRNEISADPDGISFPWHPKTLGELLGHVFLYNKTEVMSASDLSGKVLALFFTAHWSAPARAFTKELLAVYKRLREAKQPFEVIFVSSDKTVEAFDENYASMPWLAIPFSNEACRTGLMQHFEVKGIPTVVILDSNHNLITKEGRAAITADLEGAEFPWRPEPVNPLDDDAMAHLDEMPILLVMTDGSDDEIAEAIAAMTPVARKEAAKPFPKLLFYYVEEPEADILELIRKAVKIDAASTMVIVDMTYSRLYEPLTTGLTTRNIQAFVDGFCDGSIHHVGHAH